MLEMIIGQQKDVEDLTQLGFNHEEITRTINLYRKSEYKRFQFCPILKLHAKSFGFGHRIPISKNSNYQIT